MPLPHHYLITPTPHDREAFLAQLEQSLQAGIRLLWLKAKGLDAEGYRALAARVIPLAHRYDCQVLLNGDPALVGELGADGLHLESGALAACTQRPLPGYYLLGVSAHSLEGLRQGEALGASFGVLSPIHPTSAHPDLEPLGWEGMGRIVAQLAIPIYALGGVSGADEAQAIAAGGQGVAGHRGYWLGDG
jgi:8-oxo-dGTP diphosphatase